MTDFIKIPLDHAIYSRALDRIDQDTNEYDRKPFDRSYTGAGVRVFIFDLNIDLSHREFDGASNNNTIINPGESRVENREHGTAVASILAGKNTGVAPGVEMYFIHAGGQPYAISEIEDLIDLAESLDGPTVINMSLEIYFSVSSNLAWLVKLQASEKVTLFIASGNQGELYPGNTLCEHPNKYYSRGNNFQNSNMAFVGSLDPFDYLSEFSVSGTCIDFYAPGENIVGAHPNSSDTYTLLYGTSFAAPLASGVFALYLEKHKGNLSDAKRDFFQSTKILDRDLFTTETSRRLIQTPLASKIQASEVVNVYKILFYVILGTFVGFIGFRMIRKRVWKKNVEEYIELTRIKTNACINDF